MTCEMYNYTDLYPNIDSMAFEQLKTHQSTIPFMTDPSNKKLKIISSMLRTFIRLGLRSLKDVHDEGSFIDEVRMRILISASGVSFVSKLKQADCSSQRQEQKVSDLKQFRDLVEEIVKKDKLSTAKYPYNLLCFFSDIYWNNLQNEESLMFLYYNPLGYNRADTHNMIFKLNEVRNYAGIKVFDKYCTFREPGQQDYLPANLRRWGSIAKTEKRLRSVYSHNNSKPYQSTASIIRFLYNFEKHGGDPLIKGKPYHSLEYVESIRYEYFPDAVSLILLEIFNHIVVSKPPLPALIRSRALKLLWIGASSPAELAKLDYLV